MQWGMGGVPCDRAAGETDRQAVCLHAQETRLFFFFFSLFSSLSSLFTLNSFLASLSSFLPLHSSLCITSLFSIISFLHLMANYDFLADISFTSAASLRSPHVTLTFAQSLDGKIAGAHGQQLILSGDESMKATHM